jgi:hypothetical protein
MSIKPENSQKVCSFLYFYENGSRYCTQSCSTVTNYNDGSYDWKPELPITYLSFADDYQMITNCSFHHGFWSTETTCTSVNAYYDPYTGYVTQVEGPVYHYNGIVYPI